MQAKTFNPLGGARGATPLAEASATTSRASRGVVRATVHAALLASVANLVIYVMAWALWGVPAGFAVLNPVSIVISTTIGIVVAAAGLEVLAKWLRRPVPLFLASMVALTLLSLGGPIQAMAGAMSGQPAATTATGLAMIAMHLVTGGIIIGLLPYTKHR